MKTNHYDILTSPKRAESFGKWIRANEKSFYEVVRQQDVKFGSKKGLEFFKTNWRDMKTDSITACIEWSIHKYGKDRLLEEVYRKTFGVISFD